MKAAIYTRYGGPEVIRISDISKPALGEHDVLIKVCAGTVNRTDCGFRSAEYFISRFFSGLFRPKNPVLGCEFAGEVVQIGSAVTSLKVGDRVFGYDDDKFGSHAEYKRMKENGTLTL